MARAGDSWFALHETNDLEGKRYGQPVPDRSVQRFFDTRNLGGPVGRL